MEKLVPLSPRPRMTSEERRASIVEAAMRLFAEKGFRGTTTREIAAAVGVTEPVLYEHFKTKRDLYTAIIQQGADGAIEHFRALAAKYEGTGDDRGFFEDLAHLVIRVHTANGGRFVRLLLFSNLEGHELKDLFFERGGKLGLDIVAEYIERRVAEGVMQGDPAVASRCFWNIIGHHCLITLVFGCKRLPYSDEEVVRQMVDIFLRGMYRDGGTQPR